MTTTTGKNPIITGSTATIASSAPRTGVNPTLQQNAQVVTNTTTVDTVLGSVLTGVSIIPFMRSLAIDFLGYRLRPNRQIWFYFDNICVDRFVQRPNIIELNSNMKINDIRSGPQRTVRLGTYSGRILHTENSGLRGNTKLYISELEGTGTSVGTSVTIDGINTPAIAIRSYEHMSGILQSGSTNNRVIFSRDANTTIDDFYVGNTITIVNGTDAGQSSEIIGYSAATRTANVFPPFMINPRDTNTNLIYTIGDYRSWYSSNIHPSSFVTSRGVVSGVFHVPDPNKNPGIKFRTGDRVFRILDNPRNDTQSYTTRADYRFTSGGLDTSVAQIIERDISFDIPVVVVPTPTPSFTPSPTMTPTVTPTRTITPTATVSFSATSTPAVTPTSTVSPTPTPTVTPSTSSTSTPTPTVTSTVTPSITKSITPTSSTIVNVCVNQSTAQGPNLSWTVKPAKYCGFEIKLQRDRAAYCDRFGKILPATVFSGPDTSVATNVSGGSGGKGRINIYESTPAATKFALPTDSNGRTYIMFYSFVGKRYEGPFDVTGLYVFEVLYQTALSLSCLKLPHDPVAQTFYVSTQDHPDGVFISSVDLFFRNKGEILPVEVQIRPVVNGVPSSNTLIPGATTTLDPEDIQVSNFPDAANASTNTRFTFPSPVYLNSGYEYAIVVITDDYGYDYYSAAKGQTVLGTDRIVSQQPFLGSMFKSQNQMTWTPIQEEDMMFILNKANFNTDVIGTVLFEEDKKALLREISSNVNYNSGSTARPNTVYDSFNLLSDAIELNNTQIEYSFRGNSNTSRAWTTFTNIKPDRITDLESRNILFNPQIPNKSLELQVTLKTQNEQVSPILFHERQNLITIENLINDTGLTADRFVISSNGTGFVSTGPVGLSITSNSGYGANAWAVVSSGQGITSIVVDSPGVGYVDDVTVTVLAGTGAVINVSTETGTSGGPALARYISRTVTLVDGFDAGDLRVFLTAVKPPGSNVNVYYKVRNWLDPEKIENRSWRRMVQKTSQYSYSVNRTPVEYEFRPSLSSNNITYTTDTTTYKTFNQFAIKIVLSSPSTVANSLPYVLDVRAIALPEDAY